jgi:4-pyridoxolactonase
MFLDAGLTGPYRFPVYGVLVDHEEGRFLFDTGFDAEHIRKTVAWTDPAQTAEQTIPAQLHLAGFRSEEISHVINSHYHLDHCGGNKYCKHATTVCHVCELETLRSPAPSEEIPYSEVSFAPGLRTSADHGRATDMFTPRFETLKGDQELASGVLLFETLGHTAGHYSLMVKVKNRRPMLFAADACYSRQNLDLMCIQAGNHDPAAARTSLQRLKDLAEKHDAEIFFSHDAASWPKYSRAPGFYS